MSDFNSTLSDKELRELLKNYILEQKENNSITEKMIEMESKIAFGTIPVMTLALPNETQMVSKLTKSLATKSSITGWFIGIGISAVIGVGAFSLSTYTNTNKTNTPEKVPVKETPITNNEPIAQQIVIQNTIQDPKNNDNSISPVQTDSVFEEEPKDELNWFNPPAPEENNVEQRSEPEKPIVEKKSSKKEHEKNYSTDTSFTGIKKIVVHGGICDVNVKSGQDEKTHVKGDIKITAKGIGAKTGEYEFNYKRTNSTLIIDVVCTRQCNTVIAGSININGQLNIQVQSGANLELQNDNGDITLNELNGETLKASSNYGNIIANKISSNFSLNTQSGDITLTESQGEADLHSAYGSINVNDHKGNLSIAATSGDIVAEQIAGQTLNANSSYGQIHLKNITANLDISASSGDVDIDNAIGKIDLNSQYGQVKLSNITGDVKTHATSGDVNLKTIKGDITVFSTYGNIQTNDVNGDMHVVANSGDVKGKNVNIKNNMDIKSTYGNIRMQLVNSLETLSFDLQANSGDVHVKKEGSTIIGDDGRIKLDKGNIKIKAVTVSGDQFFE